MLKTTYSLLHCTTCKKTKQKQKQPTQIIIKARENGFIIWLTENIQPICWNSWPEKWIKGLLVAKKVSAVEQVTLQMSSPRGSREQNRSVFCSFSRCEPECRATLRTSGWEDQEERVLIQIWTISLFWKKGNWVPWFPKQVIEVKLKGDSQALQRSNLHPVLLQSALGQELWRGFACGLKQPSIREDHAVAPLHTGESDIQTHGLILHCFTPPCFCCHYVHLEKELQDCPSLFQSIPVNWGILVTPLLRSCYHIWAPFPCHPVLKSTTLLKLEVNGGGDSHSGAAIHTLSSSASKTWPGNANNKQTIITHNCGWTQPLMTLFNTASTLWRASSLLSHALRRISRLALPGVIPTAYSNCFAGTVQGSEPAVKPDAFCRNTLLQGNKWLFFPKPQLTAQDHRRAPTWTHTPPGAAHHLAGVHSCTVKLREGLQGGLGLEMWLKPLYAVCVSMQQTVGLYFALPLG